MGIENFALHQERVGVEHDAVANADAIMYERARTYRASGAKANVIGFEYALFQRVSLEHATFVEISVVADLG